MSKKRSSRNTKKVLKALKKKRSSYNIGGYGISRNRFSEFEPPVPKKIPAATTAPDQTVVSEATNTATTAPATTTDTGNAQMGKMTNPNRDPSESPVDEDFDPTDTG